MKNRFTHDEQQQLISFLKAYRPVPPTASKSLEERLMKRIEQEPITSKYSSSWRWIVPSTLAASLLLLWGGYSLFFPKPQMVASSEELESFLMENWTDTMGESSVTSGINSTDVNWFNLADPQVNTYDSNH